MMQMCDSCGARLKKGAVVCDLCGTPVEANTEEIKPEDSPIRTDTGSSENQAVRERPGQGAGLPKAPGVFCNQCGWENPPGARFCSACGRALQQLSQRAEGAVHSSPPPRDPAEPAARIPYGKPLSSRKEESAAIGRQIGIIVGAAVLLIFALYMITMLSGDETPAVAAPAASTQPLADEGPLPEQFAAREVEIQASIDALSGDEQIETRRDLVDLYQSAARMDLAAAEQERIAQTLDTENAWAIAGNFYYDYMESREGTTRSAAARNAIAAYQRALEINPDNLDIRTDMAIAYMYDPENPMQAILQTNKVLEADSLHIQANFNRAVMLLQINRMDEAVEQFEKVKRIVGDPQNPVYIRAEQALESMSQPGQ